MNALPLLDGFAGADATFAWRRGRPISCATFLADVDRLARALPDRGHVLNVCVDRYRFAVGLAAALVRGQVTLMPPTTHAGSIRQLVARFPDTYCLAEDPQPGIDVPQVFYADTIAAIDASERPFVIPAIPADRIVAYAFTSGSTGVPQPHAKRWGPLATNVKSEADRLGCTRATTIVATVPAQHMYGFESSLLIAWQCGAAIVAERPFYPSDIVAALERLPAPRMLVTTPFHLRALLAEVDETTPLPSVALLLCATAPLSLALADAAERRFAAPVAEIYGCTETGQLASRRPTEDPCWRLLGDVSLAIDRDGRATASGGHVEQPTVLADVLAPADDATSRRFSLVGRTGDLVNIAGKRTSLGYLDVQLNGIDGVVDGAFFMPSDDDAARDGVTRLAAIVVAPTLDAQRLAAALRERVDAAFLPRPVYFVERLPRNATGKLTRATLDAILDGRWSGTNVAAVATDHASTVDPRR